MRYIVALAAAAASVLVIHLVFGIGSLPRPWGSLGLGTVAGVVMVAVLLIWEHRSPSEDLDERDRRLKIEEAAKDEARELRRMHKRNGTWNRPAEPGASAAEPGTRRAGDGSHPAGDGSRSASDGDGRG